MIKTKYLLFSFLLSVCSLVAFKATYSYFSDTEKILGNSIQVGIWGTTVTPTPTEVPVESPPSTPTEAPTPTPTNTPAPASPVAGSVVINELMWMGSLGNPDDEWIELRNTTNSAIDLSNWQITSLVGASNTETLMLTIPGGKTIPANGYFLISNFDNNASAINVEPDLVETSVVLRNSDLQIRLYKGPWTDPTNLRDTADDGEGTPMAGLHGDNEQSMERNDDPATGWKTCNHDAGNDTIYWDIEGNNYGTPGAANL